MSKYKVKALQKYLWSSEKNCLLGISIGQGYHEGAKLESTLLWACKRFEKLHIWIADTLHRHDMMFQYCESMEQATVRSRLEGDNWLVRNSDLLQSLTIPWTMSRWDQWRGDPRFASLVGQIKFLYDNNDLFKRAVTADVERFMGSYLRRGEPLHDRSFAEQKCIDFIIEENAVFPLLREDYPGVDLILGSELQSTSLIHELPIPGAPEMCYQRKHAKILFKRLSGADTKSSNEDSIPDSAMNS
jgi:tRNA-dependent cyclodipeptide synthase